MGKARDEMRSKPEVYVPNGLNAREPGVFYRVQAELAAKRLRRPAPELRAFYEKKIYARWQPIFSRVVTYRGSHECLVALKASGFKIGFLSDFPPEDKLRRLGFDDLADCVVCSEEVGRLKPHPDSFLALAAGLGLKPAEILYVGNSARYDVVGAAGAGMKTALICRHPRRPGPGDFRFKRYSELLGWVLSGQR
jgi:putative hydrolase of the HAD superfamily